MLKRTKSKILLTLLLALLANIVFAEPKPPSDSPDRQPGTFHLPSAREPVSPCHESEKYFRDGEMDRGIQVLSLCIKKTPKNAVLYIMRGNALMMNGDLENAIKDFDHAIKLDPTSDKAFELKGAAEIKAGNSDQGIKDIDRAIELNPQNHALLIQKGNILLSLGRPRKAADIFTTALEVYPNPFFGIYSSRAAAYEVMGNYSKAVLDYDHAISLEPNFPPLYFSRGLTNFYLGRYERAMMDFRKALKKDMNEKTALMAAVTLYKMKKKSEGKMILKKALPTASQSIKPIMQLYLGKISEKKFIEAARVSQAQESIFYGFLGEYYLTRDMKDDAKKSFERCIETSRPESNIPVRFSRAELERMKGMDENMKQGMRVK